MSAAVMGTPHSPNSPQDTSSSATMSPVHPDRPIRPMPKRSLRARLSPEVADTITYPPAPSSTKNMFYIPYAEAMAQEKGDAVKNALREIDNVMSYGPQAERDDDGKINYRFKDGELDSEEEDDMGLIRRHEGYKQRPGTAPSVSRVNTTGLSRATDAMQHSVASSSESVDGYDSFENTNNKKKRKIPANASQGNHHPSFSGSLSQDLANIALSSGENIDTQDVSDGGLGHYYGSGSSAIPATASGNGLSGAGRGRYGRSGRRDISGRSPLTSSMNSSNAWQNGRLPGPRREYGSMSSLGSKVSDTPNDHGIISQAIADAASLPVAPNNGQENVSLLEQHSIKKPSPDTQFTFTCESDSTKGVVWPGDSNSNTRAYHPSMHSGNISSAVSQPSATHPRKDFHTQGTQTSPSMGNQQSQNSAPPQPGGQPQRKPRRSAAKRYAIAAHNRRAQQEYNNYHHPPKAEDIWVCEFCEYESIFGRAPEALIREYEAKDRKERKRLAEKRRLLEKAKMKGRKGKKGNKSSAKTNNSTQQHASQSNYNPPNDQIPAQNQGTQSEDYYEDEYDNEPGAPMPAPYHENPSRIPQPVSQQPGQSTQSTRAAHGAGTNRPG